MKKSILIISVITLLLLTTVFCTARSPNDISITLQIGNSIMTVNGDSKEIDTGRNTSPVIINDRTLLPIRAVIEAMNGKVDWEQQTQTAVLTVDEDVMKLTIGSTSAYFNNEIYELDTAPVIINERTMLPIRFIAEHFGFNVEWDGEQKIITITNQMPSVQNSPTAEPVRADAEDTSKILIAYYTWADNTYVEHPERVDVDAVTSASVLPPGNTGRVASRIQEITGGDIFQIKVKEQYSSNYEECLERVINEYDADARPELTDYVNNIDDYDVIFLGFPNWWYSCPMAILTFIDEHDLSGKTIIPFCAHGTGGYSDSVRDMSKELPESCTVLKPFGVYRPNVATAQPDIDAWLNELGFYPDYKQ